MQEIHDCNLFYLAGICFDGKVMKDDVFEYPYVLKLDQYWFNSGLYIQCKGAEPFKIVSFDSKIVSRECLIIDKFGIARVARYGETYNANQYAGKLYNTSEALIDMFCNLFTIKRI